MFKIQMLWLTPWFLVSINVYHIVWRVPLLFRLLNSKVLFSFRLVLYICFLKKYIFYLNSFRVSNLSNFHFLHIQQILTTTKQQKGSSEWHIIKFTNDAKPLFDIRSPIMFPYSLIIIRKPSKNFGKDNKNITISFTTNYKSLNLLVNTKNLITIWNKTEVRRLTSTRINCNTRFVGQSG